MTLQKIRDFRIEFLGGIDELANERLANPENVPPKG